MFHDQNWKYFILNVRPVFIVGLLMDFLILLTNVIL